MAWGIVGMVEGEMFGGGVDLVLDMVYISLVYLRIGGFFFGLGWNPTVYI